MTNRIDRVQSRIQQLEADAALLTFLPDIRWSCGFTGSNAVLIVHRDGADFISDGRYTAQAEREVSGAEVHIPGYNLLEYAAEEELIGEGSQVILQADHVTVSKLERLRELFPSVDWQPESDLLTKQVASKDPSEIEAIRKAQRITDEVFDYLCGWLEAGMTEQEVGAEIVYQHLRRGAEKMAFEPIVASGSNGALPHARPTSRTLQSGELVVIDMGCFVDGYASDMTRTVAIGEPSEEASRGYQVVLDAQQAALDAAHAGMTGTELDTVARQGIEDAGLGDYFSHSLGHGVGLQVHEWPRLSQHVEHELPLNAVVTIEPGVYVPEQFGVRIEDLVVIREDGIENLTASPKKLIQIG